MRRRARLQSDDLKVEIAALTDSLGSAVGGSPAENDIWVIYARTERAVAKLKLRLGTERPGAFTELPRSKRPEEFLETALEQMRRAGVLVQSRKTAEGLESLRGARTSLRAYLAELGRVRSREKRQAALSRRSSSSTSSPSS